MATARGFCRQSTTTGLGTRVACCSASAFKNMTHRKPLNWWKPIVHTAVHVFAGTVIFAIVALAAVLLGLMVKWLESMGASGYTVAVFTLLEDAIVTVDAVWFIAYIVNSGKSALKELS
ncbi:hypothetical protein [Ramlibacter sp. AN1133]|uniref:hypothetical protein n=1 Tax=Ramlibacter sp. AN1133 TaxID=3133429 RepID=UPI0030BA96D9